MRVLAEIKPAIRRIGHNQAGENRREVRQQLERRYCGLETRGALSLPLVRSERQVQDASLRLR